MSTGDNVSTLALKAIPRQSHRSSNQRVPVVLQNGPWSKRTKQTQLTVPLDRFSFGPFGLITRALAVAEFSESESLESQFSAVGLCKV